MPKDAKISDLTVSRSQIHDYLSCGYRWDLTYRRGVQTARVREALDGGSAVHRAIKGAVRAYVADGPKKWKPKASIIDETSAWAKEERKVRGKHLTEEQHEQLEVLRLEGIEIAQKALEFIDLPSLELATYKGKPIYEMEFITPLAPWKGYRCIPDLVGRERREGKKAPFWLYDWKRRDSFDEDDSEIMNLQFASMQYVLTKETDLRLAGSKLWQIKSQAPRRPNRNKDGSMSKQLIITDWATYEAALREAKLNPADYQDMKAKLAKIEWYKTIVEHRSAEEVRAVWEKVVVPAATRMANDPQVIRRMIHMPFACKGCWARELCIAELYDQDTEVLLQTDYIDTRNPRKPMPTGELVRRFELKE